MRGCPSRRSESAAKREGCWPGVKTHAGLSRLVIPRGWREGQGGMADNLTHGLAGALLAQTGLQQRYGPAATVALVVGAALPDLDALFALGGPVLSVVHHRGMTHSFLGGAGLALLGALLLWRLFRAHPSWRLVLWTSRVKVWPSVPFDS